MPRISTVLLLAVSLAPGMAGAQTTADGVAAFQRGDYRRAAEILRPIAEGRWVEEPLASFYMAMLYDGKHGLPADPVRECALYWRSIEQSGPQSIGTEAEKRAYALASSLGPDQSAACHALAQMGLGSGFQPARFELEPGHWIDVDLLGATVTNGQKTRRIELPFDLRDAQYLPFRHTELTVGRTRTARRHFIESFFWLPDRDGWQLTWRVFEVEGETIREVLGEELRRASVPQPGNAAADPRAAAQLRLNEYGQAEWMVQYEDGELTGLIATASEVRERDERDARRRESLARVDWKRSYDETRPPSFAYSDQNGCANVALYAWAENRAEVLILSVDKESFGLTADARTLDIAAHPLDLRLEVLVYGRAQYGLRPCDDVFSSEDGTPARTWKAAAGTATIQLSPPGVSSRSVHLYYATVQITDAVFVNEFGVRVRMPAPITLTALVGWIFG